MSNTDNLNSFMEGAQLWGMSQVLAAISEEKAAAAVSIGEGVAKKSLTVKDTSGVVLGNLSVSLKLTVVDDPGQMVHTSWDLPEDGLLVLPVGVIADIDAIGYQQTTLTISNSTPEDLILTPNS